IELPEREGLTTLAPSIEVARLAQPLSFMALSSNERGARASNALKAKRSPAGVRPSSSSLSIPRTQSGRKQCLRAEAVPRGGSRASGRKQCRRAEAVPQGGSSAPNGLTPAGDRCCPYAARRPRAPLIP